MNKIFIAITLVVLACGASIAQADKTKKPDIYDEKLDGNVQIEKALTDAKKNHKNVLLQFGANWCHWCHKLHELCSSDKEIAGLLKKSFVVVLVDVNGKHNEDVVKKYDNPTKLGLPVIVVLDREGKVLTTQDTGKLETGDHHEPAKVLTFLRQWVPKKQ